MQETLFVTAFPLHHEALGGGSWADRRVVSQLEEAQLSPIVFPVATLESGADSVRLEVRNDPIALLKVATRMVASRSPYMVAKFCGTRGWELRANRLRQEARGRRVIASQFPSLLLCEAARVQPSVYVAQNVDSVLAQNHNPWFLEAWGDSRRLKAIEDRLVRRVPSVAAMSRVDADRLQQMNPNSFHLPLLSQTLPSHPLEGGRAIGLIGKLSWPPNRRAIDILLEEVMPVVRAQMGVSAPQVVIAGRGTETLPPKTGVQFLGEMEDLDDFYNRISLVVVPRLGMSTGISVKMLEAIERGVPVIAPPSLADAAGANHRVIAANSVEETWQAIVQFFSRYDRGEDPEFSVQAGDNEPVQWRDLVGR